MTPEPDAEPDAEPEVRPGRDERDGTRHAGNGPGDGDARRDRLLALVAERHLGVLVTHKRDGRAQLSNVAYAYDEAQRVLRISVTDSRAKTANLRRDPRASFHVTSDDFWAYTVVEGNGDADPGRERGGRRNRRGTGGTVRRDPGRTP